MLKIKNYYLLLLMSTIIVFADDGQTDTKVDLFKDWWLKNALQHPKSDSILSHFELQGSLNQSEGNYKSNTVRVSTRIDFRKDLYTLEILTKNATATRDINQDPANRITLEDEETKYHLRLNYALTPEYYLTLGGFIERDSVMSVDRRKTYYLGVGGHPIQIKDHQLQMLIALGRDDIEYYKANTTQEISDAFEALAPGGVTNALYIQERYHWTINDLFSVDQSLDYFFKRLDNRDNGEFMVALNYQFHKNIALTLKYDIKYSQVLSGEIEALDPYNISTTDKYTTLNITLNY